MIYSIHVGSEQVDETKYPRYPDFSWHLPGAKKSAELMAELAGSFGSKTRVLANPAVEEVKEALICVQRTARYGDTVLFTYAGHGAHIPTTTGRNLAVTILLRDRMMVAGEYAEILLRFDPGVNYINVIDACESGTMHPPVMIGNFIVDPSSLAYGEHCEILLDGGEAGPISADPPPTLFDDLYNRDPGLYDRYSKMPLKPPVSGIHLGACHDDQVTYFEPYGKGGYFTLAILAALQSPNPPKTFNELRYVAESRMSGLPKPAPIPVLAPFGAATRADLLRKPLTAT